MQSWISNYIDYKVWDEITYLFPNFNGRWSLGTDEQFHPMLYRACDYLSMLGLKLIHVIKHAQDRLTPDGCWNQNIIWR